MPDSTTAREAEEWINKGVSIGKSGNYVAAIECYDKAMQLSPNSETIFLAACNNKGYAFYSAGKYSDAIESYDKALEVNSNFSDLWINKGAALQMLKKYQESIVCYDKALEIAPKCLSYQLVVYLTCLKIA
jgi:tetratricopeptide (TPR) repeat protein